MSYECERYDRPPCLRRVGDGWVIRHSYRVMPHGARRVVLVCEHCGKTVR